MIYLMLKGGLGNQLFEYAFARWLQQESKEPIIAELSLLHKSSLPHSVYMLDNFYAGSHIQKAQNALKQAPMLQKGWYRLFRYWFAIYGRLFGKEFQYQSEKLWQKFLNGRGIYLCADGYLPQKNSPVPNKIVEGYWQSPAYFSTIQDVIRQECSVSVPVSQQDASIIKQIKSQASVCLHIRRGDYVNNPVHMVCTPDYYYRAVKEIKNRISQPVFYVFSDDIPWVKKHLDFDPGMVYIEPGRSAPEELRLMYSCRHFIISNSTFSWWGQFLCEYPDKTVIAPDRWFADGRRTDLYDSSWILLSCEA